MHLSVYVRKPDLIYVNNVEVSYTRTGFGGYVVSQLSIVIPEPLETVVSEWHTTVWTLH